MTNALPGNTATENQGLEQQQEPVLAVCPAKPEIKRDLSLNTLKTNEQQLREEIEELRRVTQELAEKDEELKHDIEVIHEKIVHAEE